MNNYLWVVEMFIDGWTPTTDIGFNREEARFILARRRKEFHDESFRIIKYVRQDEAHSGTGER